MVMSLLPMNCSLESLPLIRVSAYLRLKPLTPSVTEGALYDWLGGRQEPTQKGMRDNSRAPWQLVAGCSKDRGCKLENLGFPASRDP
jgi:hypothetical protein